MQSKTQYFPSSVVGTPGTAANFELVSTPEITTPVPRKANQRHRDAYGFRRYQAPPPRDTSSSIETGALEMSAVEIKDASSRPDRMLATPFRSFIRAALLAHLERTFR